MKKIISFILLIWISNTAIHAENYPTLEETKALGLPVIIIETVNQEVPTCDFVFAPTGEDGISITNATKVPGRIQLWKDGKIVYDSGEYESGVSGMTMKIRGNTSAYYSNKKPYKIKLEKKGDLMGRDDQKYEDKEWILIDDGGGVINTYAGLKLNELLGLQWTPACMYVNIFMNGEYHGIYNLVENTKRNSDSRLNVDKKSGYIIERDPYWWNESVYFKSNSDNEYTFKYPDEDDITAEQKNYIKNVIDNLETSLSNGTYDQYIDVNSLAKWMLGHDILGTLDAAGSNIFLTKYDNTENSKLMMANLWDFGSSFRKKDQWATIHENSFFYYPQLFNNSNTAFVTAYKQLWNEKGIEVINTLINNVNEFYTTQQGIGLEASQNYDKVRWNYTDDTSNIKSAITDIDSWLEERKGWLNTSINQIETNITTIPETEENTSSIYNLYGMKVPATGLKSGIYIKNGKKYIVR